MQIQVKEQIDAETNEVWFFNMFDLNAVLVCWHKETKPKGKRTWKIVEFWDKYGRREWQMSKEPVLPDGIRKEALLQVIEKIKVKTWDEWSGGGH